MLQLSQSLRSGETKLIDVPVPEVNKGHVLIESSRSLVSLGTERMLVEFGSASLLQKALMQPQRVQEVLQKIQSDGLLDTYRAVTNKLDQEIPLGYCNVGLVTRVGQGVTSVSVGDRVISNGPHSEYVSVPENLCAVIPDDVSDDAAAFTVLGAIALQGIRLIDPDYGENIVVFGLGLIGLLAVQMLQANGCAVIGIDTDPAKCELASTYGAEVIHVSENTNIVDTVLSKTSFGADAVLIAASTSSNEVMRQSAQMCRKRGRVVLIGVVGLDINRADFYEKELSFQVSCSYGPGRYDPEYEFKGHDYPPGYVRWTERRNFEAVLRAIQKGHVDTDSLITERVQFIDCEEVYKDISNRSKIATLLQYSSKDPQTKVSIAPKTKKIDTNGLRLGLVGAGNFANATLARALKKNNATVTGVCSVGGMSARQLAVKVGADYATTSISDLLSDNSINLLVVTTRHDIHAEQVILGLDAGKSVFVEKPLCLNREELSAIQSAYANSNGHLVVGFNRRFAPLAIEAKKWISGPMSVVMTVNAGFVPDDSWVQDLEVGGGRIIGEACHFMDLANFLTGEKIEAVIANAQGAQSIASDVVTLILKMSGGSQVSINYLANGHKSYSKEKIEIFCEGKVLVIDNWRSLKGWGFSKRIDKKMSQDKGHAAQFGALFRSIENDGQPPVSVDQVFNVSEAAIASLEAIRERSWVAVNPY